MQFLEQNYNIAVMFARRLCNAPLLSGTMAAAIQRNTSRALMTTAMVVHMLVTSRTVAGECCFSPSHWS